MRESLRQHYYRPDSSKHKTLPGHLPQDTKAKSQVSVSEPGHLLFRVGVSQGLAPGETGRGGRGKCPGARLLINHALASGPAPGLFLLLARCSLPPIPILLKSPGRVRKHPPLSTPLPASLRGFAGVGGFSRASGLHQNISLSSIRLRFPMGRGCFSSLSFQRHGRHFLNSPWTSL